MLLAAALVFAAAGQSAEIKLPSARAAFALEIHAMQLHGQMLSVDAALKPGQGANLNSLSSLQLSLAPYKLSGAAVPGAANSIGKIYNLVKPQRDELRDLRLKPEEIRKRAAADKKFDAARALLELHDRIFRLQMSIAAEGFDADATGRSLAIATIRGAITSAQNMRGFAQTIEARRPSNLRKPVGIPGRFTNGKISLHTLIQKAIKLARKHNSEEAGLELKRAVNILRAPRKFGLWPNEDDRLAAIHLEMAASRLRRIENDLYPDMLLREARDLAGQAAALIVKPIVTVTAYIAFVDRETQLRGYPKMIAKMNAEILRLTEYSKAIEKISWALSSAGPSFDPESAIAELKEPHAWAKRGRVDEKFFLRTSIEAVIAELHGANPDLGAASGKLMLGKGALLIRQEVVQKSLKGIQNEYQRELAGSH